ncbi:hypothetical protein DICPUDRAFT_82008 [Dictyostelium purpureum]|uniref:Uncharacterized protein n=1 Tax=Dictyostelium purpureum TaxID=5786 RepID=F0ZV91_DICPU|nr:uncharacterized protein DICPUDRAFT_82008 [Dictyostelium purpureum]EGC32125.1 hypothetical protein DICPUDRAFT_82008 [Dictyostelium purpureum]|eukprot:XP_003291334.1 hypothetical protein DICPUDRAFT_82008 [Dictyostelium purpureum]
MGGQNPKQHPLDNTTSHNVNNNFSQPTKSQQQQPQHQQQQHQQQQHQQQQYQQNQPQQHQQQQQQPPQIKQPQQEYQSFIAKPVARRGLSQSPEFSISPPFDIPRNITRSPTPILLDGNNTGGRNIKISGDEDSPFSSPTYKMMESPFQSTAPNNNNNNNNNNKINSSPLFPGVKSPFKNNEHRERDYNYEIDSFFRTNNNSNNNLSNILNNNNNNNNK